MASEDKASWRTAPELAVSVGNGQTLFTTTVQSIHAAMHLCRECFSGVDDDLDTLLGLGYSTAQYIEKLGPYWALGLTETRSSGTQPGYTFLLFCCCFSLQDGPPTWARGVLCCIPQIPKTHIRDKYIQEPRDVFVTGDLALSTDTA